jgi:hypothetical protein
MTLEARRGARWGTVLVALGLLVGAGPMASVRAAEPDDIAGEDGDEGVEGGEGTEQPEQPEQPKDEVAQVKIEIKLESGRVVKPESAFTVDYGVDSNLEIQAEGAKHQFLLNVKRKGKEGKEAKEVSITIGYDRDGEAIIAPYTFDAKVKKREVLRIEGGIAIAFTVTPKKVEGAPPPPKEEEQPLEPEQPKEKKKKIETCDSDDPLCGVE